MPWDARLGLVLGLGITFAMAIFVYPSKESLKPKSLAPVAPITSPDTLLPDTNLPPSDGLK